VILARHVVDHRSQSREREDGMAYDEELAERVRALTVDWPQVAEKKMFGGLGFLIHGNMACGVNGGELIVRLSPEATEAALAEPGTRIFDLSGGRPMKGWVLVGPAGYRLDKDLRRWVELGAEYARSLPAK
jgi:TfoX/Sxy family transcriptional regulator of competence genes